MFVSAGRWSQLEAALDCVLRHRRVCHPDYMIWTVNPCRTTAFRGLLCCSEAQHWGGFVRMPLMLRRVEVISSGPPPTEGGPSSAPAWRVDPLILDHPPPGRTGFSVSALQPEGWEPGPTVPSDRCSCGRRRILFAPSRRPGSFNPMTSYYFVSFLSH